MRWLFLQDPERGWRWELWDGAEMIAYEEGFKTAADAVKHASQCGYKPPRRDWTSDDWPG
jgi:hypothetical protein